jgi:hypothetical protein
MVDKLKPPSSTGDRSMLASKSQARIDPSAITRDDEEEEKSETVK